MDNIVLFKSKVGDVTKKDFIKKRIIRSYFRCI